MFIYGYFKNCLDTTKKTYNKILNTPKARGAHLENEKREILSQLETSFKYQEITPSQYSELKTEFLKIDFENISKARAALINSKKMKQK